MIRPRSEKIKVYPTFDLFAWLAEEDARRVMVRGGKQVAVLTRLENNSSLPPKASLLV